MRGGDSWKGRFSHALNMVKFRLAATWKVLCEVNLTSRHIDLTGHCSAMVTLQRDDGQINGLPVCTQAHIVETFFGQ